MAVALIAAHSMVTSLGGDAATSCAAARAGLIRTQVIEGLRYVSSTDGDPAPVIVHAAPVITRGFEGTARLGRLLTAALTDLIPTLPDALTSGSPVGFYLALPSPNRTLTGTELIANAEARAAHAERAADLEGQAVDLSFAQRLLADAAAQAGFAGTPDLRHVSLDGHAGAAQCISVAVDDLARNRVALAIVAGVDSLLDDATLEWLNGTGRLKLADMPVGLRPGEACAILALAHPRQAAAVTGTFELVQVGVAAEARSLLSGATSVGVALAGLLDGVAEPAGWCDAPSAWLVCDHNGETYRANEWGHALVRLRGLHPALDDWQLWMPAESFGDTGAASALVGVCVALAAFDRGYAPGASAVVVSASESQARSALVVVGSRAQGAGSGGASGRT